MYEIGDKVIYQGADKKAYKKHGVVKSIEDKDGKPQLTVELDGGETFTAPIDDWSREFSNACTSTNSVVRNAMAVAAKNAIDLGRGIILKSKEAEEVQHLLKTKGYDAAKKYCQEKKEAIKAVDGHRGWYFLDAALDAGKWAGVYNSKRVVANAMAARNANEWIDDPKKKKAMDEIDKKADALYRQLKDIARKFDALKNEQVKVGFYFADYSDAARQIREIHGME